MIVREIKVNREAALKSFDYFNDYDDTRRYAVENCSLETIQLLDNGFNDWMTAERNKLYDNVTLTN